MIVSSAPFETSFLLLSPLNSTLLAKGELSHPFLAQRIPCHFKCVKYFTVSAIATAVQSVRKQRRKYQAIQLFAGQIPIS
jgi:hypothetical protein